MLNRLARVRYPPWALVSAALLGACASPARNSGATQELIEGLIEQSNKLETMHAIYDIEFTEYGEQQRGFIEVVYAGHDFAFFRAGQVGVAGEIGQGVWITEDYAFIQGLGGGWARIPQLWNDPPVLLLRELFPIEADANPPCVWFTFKITENNEGVVEDFSANLIRSTDEQRALFDWLTDFRDQSSDVVVRGTELGLHGRGYELWISKEHGLPTRLNLTFEDYVSKVRLREFSLDEPLDERLLFVPAEALSAEALVDWAEALGGLWRTVFQRHAGFERLGALVEAGRVEWDPAFEGRWVQFLEELHSEQVRARPEGYRRQQEDWIAERAKWVAQAVRSGGGAPGRLALEQQVRMDRTALEQRVTGLASDYLETLLEASADPDEIVPSERMLALERRVIDQLYEKLWAVPLLAEFDRRVSDASL